MATVVVTGGTGFIGSHLVDALVARGDEVHVIENRVDDKADRLNRRARYRYSGLISTGTVRACKGADVVFHLAALPRVQYSIENPEETFLVNVVGTQFLLEAARQAKVKRVVFASSSSVYGNSQTLPLSENESPQPMSPYAAHKLMGETLCQTYHRTYGMEIVCLRYFNVYGPRLDPNGPYALVIGIFLRQWLAGQSLTVTGDGTQTRDFTHVRDVVRATMLASSFRELGKGEVINIGAGREVSINELANMFSDSVRYIAPRPEPYRTRADNRLAEKLLGWRPVVRLEDGIDELKRLAKS
ncbi:NAD-dependent epimerase/dehydratase family protein [Candidatus Kaiserbacteria bacterium]|nr:NAD-dependent epimerase/dehydratase family protein [Candidatus Kaiserbacteria bacterium]